MRHIDARRRVVRKSPLVRHLPEAIIEVIANESDAVPSGGVLERIIIGEAWNFFGLERRSADHPGAAVDDLAISGAAARVVDCVAYFFVQGPSTQQRAASWNGLTQVGKSCGDRF